MEEKNKIADTALPIQSLESSEQIAEAVETLLEQIGKSIHELREEKETDCIIQKEDVEELRQRCSPMISQLKSLQSRTIGLAEKEEKEKMAPQVASIGQKKGVPEIAAFYKKSEEKMVEIKKTEVIINKDTIVRSISDLHTADKIWWDVDNKGSQMKSLTKFFELIYEDAKQGKNQILVMAGDVVELWHNTLLDEHPSTVLKLLEHKDIKMLGHLVETASKLGVQVYYMNGNHDVLLNEEGAKKIFGKEITYVKDDGLYINGILFLHGNSYDFFNSEDIIAYKNEDLYGKDPLYQSLGYYIARIYYDHHMRKCDSVHSTTKDTFTLITNEEQKLLDFPSKLPTSQIAYSVLMWLFKSVLSEKVFKFFFPIIGMKKFVRYMLQFSLYAFGRTLSDEIIVAFPYDNSLSRKVTLREVAEKLGDQYSKWFDDHPDDLYDLFFKGGLYADYSFGITSLQKTSLVVMGHSHSALYTMVPSHNSGSKIAYINDGCWGIPESLDLSKISPATFGEYIINSANNTASICLKQINEDGNCTPFTNSTQIQLIK